MLLITLIINTNLIQSAEFLDLALIALSTEDISLVNVNLCISISKIEQTMAVVGTLDENGEIDPSDADLLIEALSKVIFIIDLLILSE